MDGNPVNNADTADLRKSIDALAEIIRRDIDLRQQSALTAAPAENPNASLELAITGLITVIGSIEAKIDDIVTAITTQGVNV